MTEILIIFHYQQFFPIIQRYRSWRCFFRYFQIHRNTYYKNSPFPKLAFYLNASLMQLYILFYQMKSDSASYFAVICMLHLIKTFKNMFQCFCRHTYSCISHCDIRKKTPFYMLFRQREYHSPSFGSKFECIRQQIIKNPMQLFMIKVHVPMSR